MPIRDQVQEQMKEAMRSKDTLRLECLRMIKGALLHKEKETGKALSDEQAVAVLRSEVRKREQTADMMREHGKEAEAQEAEAEIAIIDTFLPSQLSEEQLEAKARAYLAEHPDVNHAGKLTGALKKELGDQADGKMLNEVCRKLLI